MVALGDQLHLFTPLGRFQVQRIDPLAIAAAEDEQGDVLTAPMPGKIVRQLIAAGDRVGRGAPLLVLEAMKMEHTIVAPGDGRVAALRYAEGDQVEEGAILLDFEAEHRRAARGLSGDMTESGPARRVILITGGAQGLGAAVARQMAARGWTVAIADLNEAGAQAIARACGDGAFAIGVDLARAAGPRRWSKRRWSGRAGWTCWSTAPRWRPPKPSST